MERAEPPLVVICGPTASGKTDLAINVATRLRGEIICADSRTVYRGLDIGTAKPTAEQQSVIRHWGVDLVDPDERFTVADFQSYTYKVIADIKSRGKTPIMVGGTGLYIDAILFGFQFRDDNLELREYLNTKTIDELIIYSKENNIIIPNDYRNKRYLVRIIEQGGANNIRQPQPIDNCIIVSISTGKNEIKNRISLRSNNIVNHNVVDEYEHVKRDFGDDVIGLTGNAYIAARLVANGVIKEEAMAAEISRLDYQLVRRQMTWLRRNPFILWGTADDLAAYLMDYR